MKKINIVCVGKIKENYYTDAINEYLKRLKKYAEVNVIQLPDFPDSGDSIKKESDAILARLKGYVVLFDIGGDLVSSTQLSQMIESCYNTVSEITFVIGGSNGVDDRVIDIADKRISFGRITYPHQLMRVIVAEQIYRAFTITAKASYHK